MINEDLLVCKICEKRFNHLGSHLWHKHKIKAKEYKEQFGLNYNQPLISQEIHDKKSKHWQENEEKYTKEFKRNLTKYQFKKGVVNRHYFAEQDIERILKQVKEMNNTEQRIERILKETKLTNQLEKEILKLELESLVTQAQLEQLQK